MRKRAVVVATALVLATPVPAVAQQPKLTVAQPEPLAQQRLAPERVWPTAKWASRIATGTPATGASATGDPA
ncbi:hypothetical protein JOD54_003854 [Actinokineospora baliensis]|uniref:hypothetical protein n=1 Tax=Actinokineospora baliensis TaxID=547056 RepID=UPI00195AD352|nr:hypothetical protein [Actinokineospora baliensis]MBM7773650.1 hypothetical protein [Actinokineospora baliensis]